MCSEIQGGIDRGWTVLRLLVSSGAAGGREHDRHNENQRNSGGGTRSSHKRFSSKLNTNGLSCIVDHLEGK